MVKTGREMTKRRRKYLFDRPDELAKPLMPYHIEEAWRRLQSLDNKHKAVAIIWRWTHQDENCINMKRERKIDYNTFIINLLLNLLNRSAPLFSSLSSSTLIYTHTRTLQFSQPLFGMGITIRQARMGKYSRPYKMQTCTTYLKTTNSSTTCMYTIMAKPVLSLPTTILMN